MTDSERCPTCGHEVPHGDYCANCGARLREHGSSAAIRPSAYAVDPSEHVLQPTVTSAVFPHLPHQRTAPFRVALLAVAAALLVLGYLRLTGPFVALSAAAVPLLYALYLYEVEVYEDAPIYYIGMTFGIGILLGAIWALLTGHFVTQTILLQASPQGAPVGRLLVAGVLFPLVAQLLMLVGPLILRFTRPDRSVLDGFAFGAASALGFVLATTLVYLFPELQFGPIAVAPGTLFAIRGILHGLLVPLIDLGTTALASAALWLYGRRARSLRRYGWVTSLWTALAIAGIVQVALGLVDVLVSSAAVAILIYLAVAVALLFWVRISLHLMLLTERRDDDPGTRRACPHCGTVGPRAAFCPSCGIATRSDPKLRFRGHELRAT